MDSEELRPDLAIPMWSHAGLISAGWRKSHSATQREVEGKNEERPVPAGRFPKTDTATQRLEPKMVLSAPPCPQPPEARPSQTAQRRTGKPWRIVQSPFRLLRDSTPLASSSSGGRFDVCPQLHLHWVRSIHALASSASARRKFEPKTLADIDHRCI